MYLTIFDGGVAEQLVCPGVRRVERNDLHPLREVSSLTGTHSVTVRCNDHSLLEPRRSAIVAMSRRVPNLAVNSSPQGPNTCTHRNLKALIAATVLILAWC